MAIRLAGRFLFLISAVVYATTSLTSGQTSGLGRAVRPQLPDKRQVEDFSFLSGRWRAEPGFQPVEGARPRLVTELEITASRAEIRINRGYPPVEIYRLDGPSRTSAMVGKDSSFSWPTIWPS